MKVTLPFAVVPDERKEPCGKLDLSNPNNLGLIRQAEFFCFLREKVVVRRIIRMPARFMT